jgi:hypothetical protein
MDVSICSAEKKKKPAKCPFAYKERKHMENAVKSRLESGQLDAPQTYNNIVIVPRRTTPCNTAPSGKP